MGGGAAMRAAAKVAGFGVVNAGVRGGISGVPPAVEQSVRSASWPVSAIISHAGGAEVSAAVHLPAREQLDDWELAGGVESEEEELLIGSAAPKPRLVFGRAPSRQEAEAATTELKDALEKVYLSTTADKEASIKLGLGQLIGPSLLTSSAHLETKSCISCEPKGASMPNYAMRAFSLLSESPAAQSVVASIASDPNVWDAVLQNEALTEFIQCQKMNAEFQDPISPRKCTELFDDKSQTGGSGEFKNGFMDALENIKVSVVQMVNNISGFIQNIFAFPSQDNSSAATDGNSKQTVTLGASFMALAVMAIMVVILKRR